MAAAPADSRQSSAVAGLAAQDVEDAVAEHVEEEGA